MKMARYFKQRKYLLEKKIRIKNLMKNNNKTEVQLSHYFMIGILLLVFFPHMHLKAQSEVMQKVDFPKYMAQHDLIWEEIPNQWNEGAFVGNGQVGMMIASNQPFNVSHRHYSHLLALYPLFQLNPDSPEDRDLLVKSVAHWHQIDGGKGLAGYSFSGAASLYAACGKGNDANIFLQRFLDGNLGRGMLLANTFYMEGNGRNPTIETPLSAAMSIKELLIQRWRGKIRVFPAVPYDWKEASFDQLKAQGGFLVSASRSEGKTQWIKVKSLAGQPCIVKVSGRNSAVALDKNNDIKVTKVADDAFEIDLKVGQEITLISEFYNANAVIEPVKHKESEKNRWGVKKGMNLKEIMEYEVPEYRYSHKFKNYR
jgi:alpha-L-fucosidase 2